jgi:hypothetical protein
MGGDRRSGALSPSPEEDVVALQGDLKSFALPEVLRLLSATEKSGRLEVGAPSGGGELLFGQGGILAGAVSTAPSAVEPAEIVFELLRLEGGSFAFDEGEQADGPTTAVEDAIRAAEELVVEWAEVETVVPSMRSWLTLNPDLGVTRLEITSTSWRAIVAIGGGGSVRDLGQALELNDLAACKQVKSLVEAGLVSVSSSPVVTGPTTTTTTATTAPSGGTGIDAPGFELDSFEEYEDDPVDHDLGELSADDRAVIMEERDDALLPEPLPGEGVAYEGELIEGHVDGHAFDTHDLVHEAPHLTEVEAAASDDDAAYDPFGELDGEAAPMPEASHDADDADVTPFALTAIDGDRAHRAPDIYEALTPERLDQESSPLEPIPGMPDLDEERTSLLRFLSSVKP